MHRVAKGGKALRVTSAGDSVFLLPEKVKKNLPSFGKRIFLDFSPTRDFTNGTLHRSGFTGIFDGDR